MFSYRLLCFWYWSSFICFRWYKFINILIIKWLLLPIFVTIFFLIGLCRDTLNTTIYLRPLIHLTEFTFFQVIWNHWFCVFIFLFLIRFNLMLVICFWQLILQQFFIFRHINCSKKLFIVKLCFFIHLSLLYLLRTS